MIKSADYGLKNCNFKNIPKAVGLKKFTDRRRCFLSTVLPENFSGDRSISTSIYYLLEGDDFSAFHRIKSDEIWHFYTGTSAIEIISVEEGKIRKQFLGDNPRENQFFQIVVPKNTWFAARLVNKQGFALAGCTVSPGFHFDDFEMANQKLIGQFPGIEKEIVGLIRL
jgi:uncharacterized protein